MTIRTLGAATLLTLVISTGISAQSTTPEAVAQQYFDALRADGLVATVKFMHPDALLQFKTTLLPVLELEAAEGKSELKNGLFGASSTLAQVNEMPPDVFMTAFLNVVARQAGTAKPNFTKLEIVGVVPEGTQRHVLSRLTVGVNELSVTKLEVLSLVPFENTWRLQLNEEMKGMAAALKTRVQQRRPQQ